MISSTVSSSYLLSSLALPVQQAQQQLADAQIETSTGQYANLGLQLGAMSGYEVSLKNQLNVINAFQASNSIISTNLNVTTSALDSIRSGAQKALQDVTTWTPGNNSGTILQNLGINSLQSLIDQANTTSNGQYVFGGVNNGAAPLANYFSSPTSAAKTAVDQAFQSTFGVSPTSPGAASISASSLQSFLTNTFPTLFQGTAWTTNWSSASSTNTTANIASGQTIETSTNANQPGFQQLAEAYTMLTEFAGSSLSEAAQQVVASTASSLLGQGLSSMTNQEGSVGSSQAALTDANTQLSAQSTLLQTQIGNLDNVNSYEVATKVNDLTTQIQTAYELTARLQTLNLAQYLPVP